MIVTLAPNGCLLDQLKKNRENPYYNVSKKEINFTPQDKVKIARDVARGMLHLASKKVQDPITNSKKYLLSRGFFYSYLASLS